MRPSYAKPALAVLLSVVLPAVVRPAEVFSPDLLHDRLWDDGKAEYDVYRATEAREGILRPAEVIHLIVKEPFNERSRVKADRPPAIDVVKMNQIINVPTGVYAYHQMHSSFWDRASGTLLKFSLSSNDACGNTFKEGWLANGFVRIVFHSYWDGEADGKLRTRLPQAAVFYDELPMKLRCLRRFDAAEYAIRLFSSVIGSKIGRPEFSDARIRVLPAGPDGAIRVDVIHRGGTDRLTFGKAAPHVLIAWVRADGSSLELKKTQRLDYWNHDRPGDEKLLE